MRVCGKAVSCEAVLMSKLDAVKIGFQVFTSEGGEELGAVRAVSPHELLLYVENAGEFVVRSEAVSRVHDGKVILDAAHIDPSLRRAIGHAHDKEEPGA
jgi:hypothetical protein